MWFQKTFSQKSSNLMPRNSLTTPLVPKGRVALLSEPLNMVHWVRLVQQVSYGHQLSTAQARAPRGSLIPPGLAMLWLEALRQDCNKTWHLTKLPLMAMLQQVLLWSRSASLNLKSMVSSRLGMGSKSKKDWRNTVRDWKVYRRVLTPECGTSWYFPFSFSCGNCWQGRCRPRCR